LNKGDKNERKEAFLKLKNRIGCATESPEYYESETFVFKRVMEILFVLSGVLKFLAWCFLFLTSPIWLIPYLTYQIHKSKN